MTQLNPLVGGHQQPLSSGYVNILKKKVTSRIATSLFQKKHQNVDCSSFLHVWVPLFLNTAKHVASTAMIRCFNSLCSPPIWQLEPLVPREEGKNKFKSTKNCVTVLAIRKHKGHVVFGLFAVHVTDHLLSSKEKKQVDLQNMGRNIEVFRESCLDYCLFLERKLGGG